MTFNNPVFLFLFLPVCVAGFALLGRFGRRSAIGWLAFMSVVFYAAWSLPYVALLASSVLWNYFVSLRIAASSGRESVQTRWLTAGIAVNLLGLGYFKYLFPFLGYVQTMTHGRWSFGSIILPLGISFFTFTQIAYLVDLKQGVAQKEPLLSYIFFVTFFPHLVAGPILHHKEMMPQVRQERRYGLNSADVGLGLTWFAMGLFKKVIVADRIAPVADAAFAHAHNIAGTDAWQGVLTYAMQLYFDFSGYSDMAMGLARIFSLRFPLNFNSPYKAASITEFWERWHMTLTQYITSYVYTPLLMAISRRRQERGLKTNAKVRATAEGFATIIALPTLFTMFLVGWWHGAGVQFFLYGLLHGVYITVNHAWRTFVPAGSRARRLIGGPVAVGLTFLAVMMAFVLFRADGLADARAVYAGLLGLHGRGPHVGVRTLGKYASLLAVVWLMPNTQEILGEQGHERGEQQPNWTLVQPRRWQPTPVWWMAATLTLLVALAYSSAATTFLYFQF